jgi:uncharacterized membrane protein (UPF0127 family)
VKKCTSRRAPGASHHPTWFREPMDASTEFAVTTARSPADRARGLARRDALPAREALLIPRCRSVHTFGMRFALDLVWLGRDGGVVRVDRSVSPRRVRTCLRARSVVELGAGRAEAFLAAEPA